MIRDKHELKVEGDLDMAMVQALSQKKRVGCPNPKASKLEVVTARRRDATCVRHNVL